jgi:capsular polysaccharide biosynthesis protein
MELRRYGAMLLKRWLLILVTVAVAIGIAVVVTPRKALYTAQSTIVVGPRQYSFGATTNGAIPSADQAVGIGYLLQTYADLIPTEPIAADAVAATGVPRSAPQVAAETHAAPVANTQLLVVSVTDPEPAIAEQLATGVATAFVNKVQSFKSADASSAGSLPSIPVYVFEPAQLPTAPHSTGLLRNVIVAAIFGLLAALAVVALAEYLDVTIKTPEDAERRLGLPVLGTIPYHSFPSAPEVVEARAQVATLSSTNGHA